LCKATGTSLGEIVIFNLQSLDFSTKLMNKQDGDIHALKMAEKRTSIDAFAVSNDGKFLAYGCSNGFVQLYDLRKCKNNSYDIKPIFKKNSIIEHGIVSCSFNSNGRYLCVSTTEAENFVFDLRKSSEPLLQINHATINHEEMKHNKEKNGGRVSSVWCNNPSSALLATTGTDSIVRLWEIKSLESNAKNSAALDAVEVNSFRMHNDLNFVRFSRDDRYLACGTSNGLFVYTVGDL